jgi:hypothetical protein
VDEQFSPLMKALTGTTANGLGWKPQSMQFTVLMPYVLISLALAVAIEVLAQKSSTQGGLALSKSLTDIPSLVTFSYLALPTILAVFYSLAWTWIDLDVRRIQPWLELSRAHGSLASKSLFLDYPFEFLALVPFKAWKQRYLTVLTIINVLC